MFLSHVDWFLRVCWSDRSCSHVACLLVRSFATLCHMAKFSRCLCLTQKWSTAGNGRSRNTVDRVYLYSFVGRSKLSNSRAQCEAHKRSLKRLPSFSLCVRKICPSLALASCPVGFASADANIHLTANYFNCSYY